MEDTKAMGVVPCAPKFDQRFARSLAQVENATVVEWLPTEAVVVYNDVNRLRPYMFSKAM